LPISRPVRGHGSSPVVEVHCNDLGQSSVLCQSRIRPRFFAILPALSVESVAMLLA